MKRLVVRVVLLRYGITWLVTLSTFLPLLVLICPLVARIFTLVCNTCTTHQCIRPSIHNTCLSTQSICLSTCSAQNTICWSFITDCKIGAFQLET